MIALVIGAGWMLHRDYQAELTKSDLVASNATLGHQHLTKALIDSIATSARLSVPARPSDPDQLQRRLDRLVSRHSELRGAALIS